MDDEALPEGYGILPDWWLEGVLHDVRDLELPKEGQSQRQSNGVPSADESMKDETKAIEVQKHNDETKDVGGVSQAAAAANNLEKAQEENVIVDIYKEEPPIIAEDDDNVAVDIYTEEGGPPILADDDDDMDRKLNIMTLTSQEEAAVVEDRRTKSDGNEEYGQGNLRSRPGNIKTVESMYMNRDKYGNVPSDEEGGETPKEEPSPSQGASSKEESPSVANNQAATNTTTTTTTTTDAVTTPSSTTSNGSNKKKWSPSPKSAASTPRQFKTNFTGVSHFDFAMQQRVKEKERREKERLAREALARHHAVSVQGDRAAELKERDEAERRKKREAQENLQSYKFTK